MSEAAKQDQLTELASSHAERAADLSELLGHVNTSWDNERRALSRQLHDSLGSSLTALTMHLSLLAQHLPQERAVQDRAAQMKQLLLNIIETNRQMQHKLWNDKLEFLGVTVAMSEVATEFGEQNAITVRCSLPEEELSCPRPYGVTLLRTMEEALSNVAAHAGATEVDIILDDNDEEITLTVRDNGIGPADKGNGQASADGAEQASPHSRHGLRNVRERAVYLGGSLQLSRNDSGGTTLTLMLPRDPVGA